MSEERWLPVVGYERYEVSDQGRVRNRTGVIFTPQIRRRNYAVVSLVGGSPVYRSTHPIHSLVMKAFTGPRPEGLEVNHKDGDKLNNRLENLEYVTKRENCLHRFHVLGKRNLPILRGADQPMSKLTDAVVLEVRRLALEGEIPQTEIAQRFGINQASVSLIKSGKRWKHLWP